jgi:hypothetical protein
LTGAAQRRATPAALPRTPAAMECAAPRRDDGCCRAAAAGRRRDRDAPRAPRALLPAPLTPAAHACACGDGPTPFRFKAKRCRLDWRLLHGVDPDRVVRSALRGRPCTTQT